MDNLFVIALIFTYFGIPPALQHRVLYWGILGALILRGLMIVAGAALIARFEWVIYIFGGLLLITALRLLRAGSEKVDPDRNLLVRAARRLYPVTSEFHGHHFFVKVEGIRTATPLFVALVAVESTDLLFAFDSIPAIFAITRDPFLVFTSNVFAVLGLRSLYFALAGMVERFHYLKPALVTVLAFIGVKMLLSHHLRIPTGISLTFIASILAVGVGASLLSPAERDGSDGDGESGSTTPS
jgi:tellurite resistance protein TerC